MNAWGVLCMLIDKLLSNLSVEVEPFAICSLSDGWRLELPAPPVPLLHFVLKGEGSVYGNTDEAHAFGSSWIAVVPPGSTHALEAPGSPEHKLVIDAIPDDQPMCNVVAGSEDDACLVVACGLVTVRYGASFNVFDRLREVLTVDLTNIPHLKGMFQDILAEQENALSGSTAMTQALMTQCLVHLFRSLPEDDIAQLPWLAALHDPRLSPAIDAVLQDPATDHTVESLAEVASMSRSSFASHFHETLGRTPMSLVHDVRMQTAARLLEDPELSIDAVAARVGFASRSHFSSSFKKHSGISPARFREPGGGAARKSA